MTDLLDPDCSDAIRMALARAVLKGKLGVVAEVTGIDGGVKHLRELMTSTGEIDIMDRAMLMSLLD